MTSHYYTKMFSLKGKTAIVTGGAGFLGKRFCAGLAEFGADVAVVDLDEKTASAYAAELVDTCDVRSVGIGCDVSSPESVGRMVDRVTDALGGIHVLHNNAATKSDDLKAFFAPFETYDLEQWRNVMSVNIDGMFLVAQAVGRQMLRQKTGGSIIQTSSIYGIMGPDSRIYEGSQYLGMEINTPAVYSTSKAAVVGLTRHLATQWAGKGIRVNCLVPGGVDSGQNDVFREKYSARIPLGRMARADEMVGTLLYLASDASSYVTGQSIIVDGGLSAW